MILKKNRNDQSDQELLNAFVHKNDRHAMDILFLRYSHHIYSVCYSFLKNRDDAQDAVLEIFQKLLSIENTKKIENFNKWLFIVSKNHCISQLRKKRQVFISLDNVEIFEKSNMENDKLKRPIYEEDIYQNNLDKALEQLNETQRQCILLFYFERKKYQQISDITGLPINLVKSSLQNGKILLKKILLKMKDDGS